MEHATLQATRRGRCHAWGRFEGRALANCTARFRRGLAQAGEARFKASMASFRPDFHDPPEVRGRGEGLGHGATGMPAGRPRSPTEQRLAETVPFVPYVVSAGSASQDSPLPDAGRPRQAAQHEPC